jgi:acyl carrier protein
MELKSFIDHFAAQFEETEPGKFSAATRFRDEIEEWSSFTAYAVIAMVDTEYGVSIKGEDIRSSNTIEDIFNIVKARAVLK